MHFGVIGGGIVGLTTALQLQNEYRNANVTIIADQFNQNTCSYVAAGIFRPSTNFIGPTLEITQKWINDAYEYWDDIRRHEIAAEAGVCRISGYIFSKIEPSIVRNHFLEKLLPIYRQTDEEELKLCHGNWKYGSFFTTLLTESKLFLPYAMKKFQRQGGQFNHKSIQTLTELNGQFDVVINCSGMGAKNLCLDNQLIPIRGQIIKVKAPWIKMAFYGDFDTYIIPGFEGVTLGGCRQFDSYDMNLSTYDRLAIQERCNLMLPSLKNANIIREAVGLRPYRSMVRVECEFLKCNTLTTPTNHSNTNIMKIIHNYGHGGYGVTTAPGTAKYAVNLVHDILSVSGTSKL